MFTFLIILLLLTMTNVLLLLLSLAKLDKGTKKGAAPQLFKKKSESEKTMPVYKVYKEAI